MNCFIHERGLLFILGRNLITFINMYQCDGKERLVFTDKARLFE